jgi:hypothetical protein
MDGGWGGGRGGGIGGGSGRGSGSGAFGAFGFTEPNPNALEGKFYDLKQTRDGVPTQITNAGVESAIVSFVSNGWKEESLRQYYQAPKILYQARFLMPIMDANEAPRAFKCGPEVAPQRWVVVYRGVVTPPKSGRYRFVGAGDDVMVVRFHGRHVFDYGYCSGTTGMGIYDNYWFFKGGTRNPKFKYHDNSRYPVPLPLTLYPYASTRIWNREIGGIAAGAEFEAESGKPYSIEILISEIPGGLFCASLLIEEVGATYQKTPEGWPVLPLFRLDHSSPPQSTGDDNVPPFAPDGPVWKRLPGHGRLDI